MSDEQEIINADQPPSDTIIWKKNSSGQAWVTEDWDEEANIARLKFFRTHHGFETQTEWAEHIGMGYKKWTSYERGYPMPRQSIFTVRRTFPDFSPDWIWWGYIGGLSVAFWRAALHAGVPQQSLEEFEKRNGDAP